MYNQRMHIQRNFENILYQRLQEESNFIQVIMGPRQVGKTSGVQFILQKYYVENEYSYYTAEEVIGSHDWVVDIYQKCLSQNKKILVIDEIQKIENWSESLKLIWDKNKKSNQVRLHIVILGSSSLQLSIGLSDSLAGRYEIIRVHHWNYSESNQLRQMSLDDYLHFGGYPGSYSLINQSSRFRQYLIDGIFEAVIAKDIFRYAQIKKPALFKQLFQLISHYPAREVSYNKLLGQLQDAGNVDQMKYYLDLLSQAFLIHQIFKFTQTPLSRKSSPKLIISAPVFTSILTDEDLTKEDLGFVFESVVGQRLCEAFDSVFYWRNGNDEVDFVVKIKNHIYAIEVKSKKRKNSGLSVFKSEFRNAKTLYIDFERYFEFEKNPRLFIEKYSL